MKNGGEIAGDAVVIATGGLSYPLTGSPGTGIFWRRRRATAWPSRSPPLCPSCPRDRFCADASGASLKNVAVRVIDRTGGRGFSGTSA
jgi:predicted flavoprotein YhiN